MTMEAGATRTILLPTGRLDIRIEDAAWPLDELCDFAARENPRRGFLVVSRVLGRHLPTAPQTMRRSVRDLAARLPADLPGPVMVVGLAETAVCLGQTVHEELRRTRDDAFFIHSTRQQLDAPLLCRFDEPHSHASTHLIYRPEGLPVPRSLVIVDDEISTGTTLRNLADALVAAWPGISEIAVATLTDWSSGHDWPSRMPRPTRVASLLRGRLDWTQGSAVPADTTFDASAVSLGQMTSPYNFGRLGLAAPIACGPTGIPPVPARLRIVGTGEFTYLPFRLAETLAARGHDVVVQATSRSPARIGAAMKTKLRFDDNYGTGVPNFLYNADPGDGRATWIAHETGAVSIDPALVAALDATLIGWDR